MCRGKHFGTTMIRLPEQFRGPHRLPRDVNPDYIGQRLIECSNSNEEVIDFRAAGPLGE